MLNAEEKSLIIKMFIEKKMSIEKLKELKLDIFKIPMKDKIDIAKLAVQAGYSVANLADIGIKVKDFLPEDQAVIQRIVASNKLRNNILETLQER